MSSETSFRNVSPRLATSANIDLLSLCLGCKMDCTIRSDTRVELRIAIEKVNENRGLALFEDQGKIWTPPNPTRGFSVQNPGGRFSFCCVPRLNLLEKIVGFPPPSHALPPRGKGFGDGHRGSRLGRGYIIPCRFVSPEGRGRPRARARVDTSANRTGLSP